MSETVASLDLSFAGIAATVSRSERIGRAEARWLWENASDEELRTLAQAVRGRFHAPVSATYMVMRIINYTNVCVAQCDYCAFYRLPSQDGGYVLSHEQVFAKLDELLALGGDLAAFNGGFNPHLPLSYYCDLFAAIRARYGDALEFYALTIAEFMYLADHAKLSYAEAAARLKASGVRWITGGGSEILTEEFRARHSKFKYTVAQFFDAQRAIVEAGLKTTATMVIGFDETSGRAAGAPGAHAAVSGPAFVCEGPGSGHWPVFSAGPSSRTSRRSAASRFRRRSISGTSHLAASTSIIFLASALRC